ncbi:hypothetical protein UCDDA912_g01885 [Diaporthe ampelina]|uniref:Uncharacterized protein n=1 Tax=Diaporthe ampelina TaxID=1214573 RepID=A0A0G2FVB9_9PEZI|nr:hypothetical protein UCDDA912_g01885 [Diaporthe ampelina]
MAPTPQSRFLEGSMNDRASNAPPPDFLGLDANTTAEYERQFALDWQPPDLGLRHHGTRNSFMSVNSAASSATTTRKQNGPSFLAPLWGGVKERLSLNRSKSSNNVHDHDEDSSCHGHFITPTFKHQRSESINVGTRSRHAEADSLAASGDGAKLKKFPSAAAIPNASMPGPAPFDPTGRPTRDEISANYQSLFSLDSGRRSFDFQLGNDSNRGIKRPFTATNDSDMSLDRPSYDAINGDGSGAMVTASENGGHESGARKLVKKLRKSASRISIDLGKSISRPASSNFDANDGDVDITDSTSLPRKSMSSSIRRSFSWRLGRSAPDGKDDSRHGDAIGNGDSTDSAVEAPAAPPFKSERFVPPSLSVIMDAPESPERNKLKKRDIRGRRLRRQEASNRSFAAPSLHQAPSPFLPPPTDGDAAMTMDWQSTRHSDRSKSRSRSRPRRSELSVMMMQPQPQSQSRPGTAHSTDSSYSFTTSSVAASFEPRRSAEVAQAADDRMDGVEPVEFVIPSFHFPNRVRPGNPLTVIPDANRGIPSVPNIPGEFRDVKIVAASPRGENGEDEVDVDGVGGNGGAQTSAWHSPQAVS